MKAKSRKTARRAKKQRFWRCNSCKKRFPSAQAVRGHQLHCRVRRLTMQAEAQPASASGNREPPEHHRPGPDSQENKLLLLDTYESIQALIKVLEHIAVSAEFYFRTAFSRVEGNIPPEEWAKLYDDLCNVERDFEQMVALLRLNRRSLFDTYHRLGAIRETWLAYRDHDQMQSEIRGERSTVTSAANPDNATSMTNSEKMVVEDKSRLDDVANKVKRLLVAAR